MTELELIEKLVNISDYIRSEYPDASVSPKFGLFDDFTRDMIVRRSSSLVVNIRQIEQSLLDNLREKFNAGYFLHANGDNIEMYIWIKK